MRPIPILLRSGRRLLPCPRPFSAGNAFSGLRWPSAESHLPPACSARQRLRRRKRRLAKILRQLGSLQKTFLLLRRIARESRFPSIPIERTGRGGHDRRLLFRPSL